MLSGSLLTLWRGTNCLFEALSFECQPGAVLLIQGPNGAGKTTLLRVMAGLTRPDEGSLEWQGQDLRQQLQAGMLRLAFAGHNLALKTELTIKQNLEFFAGMAGFAGSIDELVAATGLQGCRDLDVRLLSAGQKRRAALARVLLSDATLWLLDEPQTNLDTAGRELLEAAIVGQVRRGGTVVVATHQSLNLSDIAVGHLRLGECR